MKYYLVVTGMTVGSLVAIIGADDIKPMRNEPEYIQPVNAKVFWANSPLTYAKAEEKIKVFEDLGYEKDLTFTARGLIEALFGHIPVVQ